MTRSCDGAKGEQTQEYLSLAFDQFHGTEDKRQEKSTRHSAQGLRIMKMERLIQAPRVEEVYSS